MDIYVANEKYDGYLRDGCVFRNDVNIFDKMAATIHYKKWGTGGIFVNNLFSL